MNDVLRDLIDAGVVVYLDDILVYTGSHSEQDHLVKLRTMLQKLRDHHLYVQLPKCQFMSTRLEHLGHIIDSSGIQVDPTKVQVVQDWPVPWSVGELQSFLGMANYYRKFIHHFATMVTPSTK